jgi:hypothetical protein
MILRWLLVIALAVSVAGCNSAEKRRKAAEKARIKSEAPKIPDQNSDVTFQSFLSRLRKAAAKRDRNEMANMMLANFGYSWAPGGEGAGVFQYWDANNLWPELNLVLQEHFVPSGDYMVAPAQVTVDPDYNGYRAGLRLVNGSWRFAYFVSAPPASAPAPAAAPASGAVPQVQAQ